MEHRLTRRGERPSVGFESGATPCGVLGQAKAGKELDSRPPSLIPARSLITLLLANW
jgi:hypothetical protein